MENHISLLQKEIHWKEDSARKEIVTEGHLRLATEKQLELCQAQMDRLCQLNDRLTESICNVASAQSIQHPHHSQDSTTNIHRNQVSTPTNDIAWHQMRELTNRPTKIQMEERHYNGTI